ncbi:hypothetical protein M5W90_25460 [Paenibacillus thiaminolyticus]|uniref:hypothetical protein n=1 Tax=Paenibacillus thiaminolyticus TaxID=49283 RepID=UPI000E04D436|nr:hypothetical protein [Paenibacillus thiaminolyticus]MCY9538432.1 hypothetical protein [Paenibacillus thiaminolyticus]MCY9616131.1 hypothetical protein [Paenibacillus thiaminolyticus]MCY9656263.1 hypothetical protein [Paenibacillus thiaminolyticus]MCY9743984.1 hypothetical protein [Paenibacillus thiaminolyticus]CAH8713412.1 hypothetical protein KYE0_003239 [Paenibacillus thiaminolyticus]
MSMIHCEGVKLQASQRPVSLICPYLHIKPVTFAAKLSILAVQQTAQPNEKARGYRSEKNIIAMVYVLAGKLNFALK